MILGSTLGTPPHSLNTSLGTEEQFPAHPLCDQSLQKNKQQNQIIAKVN